MECTVEWWKEWNQAHSLTKELKEELRRELKESLKEYFTELQVGRCNQTQQNVTKEVEMKKKEHEEKEKMEKEEEDRERVEKEEQGRKKAEETSNQTKKTFVMFEGFDIKPSDQLADHWRQLISDAVQKLPLPANISQEQAFNPSQAHHNNYHRCVRVQHIKGQLYVYLDQYSTFQAWYPPPKHII